MDSISFGSVSAGDVETAIKLELAGFPADEAASLESLQYRQSVAPTLFLGAYNSTTLIGFVCATLTPSAVLTHASMATHDPAGNYVAIHSVCVDKAQQRKGIATKLLKEYLNRLRAAKRYHGARLIAHDELVGLYQGAGFELVGKSAVVHGRRPWFELRVDFEQSPSTPAVVVRSPGMEWSTLSGVAELLDGKGTNNADLYCPRGECKCLLLRKGAGRWMESPGEFALPALPRRIGEIVVETPSRGFWSVPSPLAFENIGFSRNAAPPTSTALASTTSPTTIKYLICADCDYGPLGWHDTEGRDLGMEVAAENEGKGNDVEKVRKARDFLLDVTRLRYKA